MKHKALLRKVSIIGVSAACCFALVGCGGTESSSSVSGGDSATQSGSSSSASYSTSLEDIKAKGQLVIGLDDTFAPMGFRDTEGELVAQDFVVRILRVERVAEELQRAGEHEAVVVASLHRRDQRDAAGGVLAHAFARQRGRRVITRHDGHGKHVVRVDTQTVPFVGDGAGASGQISHQTGNLQISTQRSQDLQIIRSLELRVADVARFGNSREMIDNTAALRIDLNASVSSERTNENRRIAREHHKNIAMEVKKATEGLGVQTIVFLIRVDH